MAEPPARRAARWRERRRGRFGIGDRRDRCRGCRRAPDRAVSGRGAVPGVPRCRRRAGAGRGPVGVAGSTATWVRADGVSGTGIGHSRFAGWSSVLLVPIDNPVAPTPLPQTCHPIDALDGSVGGVGSAIDLAEVEGLTASDRAQMRAADRQYQRALDRRCQVLARQRADRAAVSVGVAIALTLAVLVVSARRRRALPAPSATDKGFR